MIWRRVKKPVSLLTAGAFFVQCFLPSVAQAQQTTTPEPSFYSRNASQLLDYYPPSDLARVTDSFFAVNRSTAALQHDSTPLVILIQDLHCHPAVQREISKLLEHYSSQGQGAMFVAAEGAQGLVDTSVVASLPDSPAKNQVIDEYLDKGTLTGMEAYSMRSGNGKLLWGVDDQKTYNQHLSLFRESFEGRNRLHELLSGLETNLETLGNVRFSKDLKKLQNKQTAYKAGTLSLSDYLVFLKKEAKAQSLAYPEILDRMEKLLVLEKSLPKPAALKRQTQSFLTLLHPRLNQDETENLAKYAKSNNTAYYLYLQSLAETHQMLESCPQGLKDFLQYTQTHERFPLQELESQLGSSAFRIQMSKAGEGFSSRLLQASRDVALLKDLLELKLTRDDFAQVLTRHKALAAELTYFLKDEYAETDLQELLAEAVDFYALALMRDKPLTEQTLAKLTKTTILVTGGFHTEGIAARLKEKGISYLLLSPQVDSYTQKDQERYVELLLGDKGPSHAAPTQSLTPPLNKPALYTTMAAAILSLAAVVVGLPDASHHALPLLSAAPTLGFRNAQELKGYPERSNSLAFYPKSRLILNKISGENNLFLRKLTILDSAEAPLISSDVSFKGRIKDQLVIAQDESSAFAITVDESGEHRLLRFALNQRDKTVTNSAETISLPESDLEMLHTASDLYALNRHTLFFMTEKYESAGSPPWDYVRVDMGPSGMSLTKSMIDDTQKKLIAKYDKPIAAAHSPDGRFVFLVNAKEILRLDLTGKTVIVQSLPNKTNIRGISFTDNGNTVLLKHSQGPTSINYYSAHSFSPDGIWWDEGISLWILKAPVEVPFEGANLQFNDLADLKLSPEGDYALAVVHFLQTRSVHTRDIPVLLKTISPTSAVSKVSQRVRPLLREIDSLADGQGSQEIRGLTRQIHQILEQFIRIPIIFILGLAAAALFLSHAIGSSEHALPLLSAAAGALPLFRVMAPVTTVLKSTPIALVKPNRPFFSSDGKKAIGNVGSPDDAGMSEIMSFTIKTPFSIDAAAKMEPMPGPNPERWFHDLLDVTPDGRHLLAIRKARTTAETSYLEKWTLEKPYGGKVLQSQRIMIVERSLRRFLELTGYYKVIDAHFLPHSDRKIAVFMEDAKGGHFVMQTTLDLNDQIDKIGESKTSFANLPQDSSIQKSISGLGEVVAKRDDLKYSRDGLTAVGLVEILDGRQKWCVVQVFFKQPYRTDRITKGKVLLEEGQHLPGVDGGWAFAEKPSLFFRDDMMMVDVMHEGESRPITIQRQLSKPSSLKKRLSRAATAAVVLAALMSVGLAGFEGTLLSAAMPLVFGRAFVLGNFGNTIFHEDAWPTFYPRSLKGWFKSEGTDKTQWDWKFYVQHLNSAELELGARILLQKGDSFSGLKRGKITKVHGGLTISQDEKFAFAIADVEGGKDGPIDHGLIRFEFNDEGLFRDAKNIPSRDPRLYLNASELFAPNGDTLFFLTGIKKMAGWDYRKLLIGSGSESLLNDEGIRWSNRTLKPSALAQTPDGRFAFLAQPDNEKILRIDLQSPGHPIHHLHNFDQAKEIFFTDNGNTVVLGKPNRKAQGVGESMDAFFPGGIQPGVEYQAYPFDKTVGSWEIENRLGMSLAAPFPIPHTDMYGPNRKEWFTGLTHLSMSPAGGPALAVLHHPAAGTQLTLLEHIEPQSEDTGRLRRIVSSLLLLALATASAALFLSPDVISSDHVLPLLSAAPFAKGWVLAEDKGVGQVSHFTDGQITNIFLDADPSFHPGLPFAVVKVGESLKPEGPFDWRFKMVPIGSTDRVDDLRGSPDYLRQNQSVRDVGEIRDVRRGLCFSKDGRSAFALALITGRRQYDLVRFDLDPQGQIQSGTIFNTDLASLEGSRSKLLWAPDSHMVYSLTEKKDGWTLIRTDLRPQGVSLPFTVLKKIEKGEATVYNLPREHPLDIQPTSDGNYLLLLYSNQVVALQWKRSGERENFPSLVLENMPAWKMEAPYGFKELKEMHLIQGGKTVVFGGREDFRGTNRVAAYSFDFEKGQIISCLWMTNSGQIIPEWGPLKDIADVIPSPQGDYAISRLSLNRSGPLLHWSLALLKMDPHGNGAMPHFKDVLEAMSSKMASLEKMPMDSNTLRADITNLKAKIDEILKEHSGLLSLVLVLALATASLLSPSLTQALQNVDMTCVGERAMDWFEPGVLGNESVAASVKILPYIESVRFRVPGGGVERPTAFFNQAGTLAVGNIPITGEIGRMPVVFSPAEPFVIDERTLVEPLFRLDSFKGRIVVLDISQDGQAMLVLRFPRSSDDLFNDRSTLEKWVLEGKNQIDRIYLRNNPPVKVVKIIKILSPDTRIQTDKAGRLTSLHFFKANFLPGTDKKLNVVIRVDHHPCSLQIQLDENDKPELGSVTARWQPLLHRGGEIKGLGVVGSTLDFLQYSRDGRSATTVLALKEKHYVPFDAQILQLVQVFFDEPFGEKITGGRTILVEGQKVGRLKEKGWVFAVPLGLRVQDDVVRVDVREKGEGHVTHHTLQLPLSVFPKAKRAKGRGLQIVIAAFLSLSSFFLALRGKSVEAAPPIPPGLEQRVDGMPEGRALAIPEPPRIPDVLPSRRFAGDRTEREAALNEFLAQRAMRGGA